MNFSLSKVNVSDPRSLMEGVRELFSLQRLAVLSTSEEGRPYCSLIAFAATDDIGHLVFVTNRSTRKFMNLTQDPRVSLLVDNRSNEMSDFHNAMAVTAMGNAAEIPDNERALFLKLYLCKHPHLEEFALSPGCAMVGVRVSRYSIVQQFQNVMVLQLEP